MRPLPPAARIADRSERHRSASVVIPVFNAERTLDELTLRLVAVLDGMGREFELIYVNDGSQDGSWSAIERISSREPRAVGIDLMRNYGQHNALLAGIRAAKNEVVVTIDDDLQHMPEDLPPLLGKLDEGYDVVYGTPRSQQHGRIRDLASTLTKLVLQATMGAESARHISAFRAIRAEAREGFANYSSNYVNIDVLLSWGTSRISSVPVAHARRQRGGSGYSLARLFAHAFNMITGFSSLPLHLASILGFSMTGVGALLLLYVLARYLIEGGSVPGFPFLAAIIVVFSGAQLVALGIIGQYLARIHFRTMERPPYAVRTMTEALVRDDRR